MFPIDSDATVLIGSQ